MGKMQRQKGHSFERECAIAFRRLYPNARRHLEYQDGQCFGVDLAEVGLYRVQCKRGRRFAPLSAINEIIYDKELGEIPLLITRADNETALVAMPFEHFLELLETIKKV